jgi:hypothetical protein
LKRRWTWKRRKCASRTLDSWARPASSAIAWYLCNHIGAEEDTAVRKVSSFNSTSFNFNFSIDSNFILGPPRLLRHRLVLLLAYRNDTVRKVPILSSTSFTKIVS